LGRMDYQPLRMPFLAQRTMSKYVRPGTEKEKTLLLERYVWWQWKAGLAFHFEGQSKG
jgi:hypothetical protein